MLLEHGGVPGTRYFGTAGVTLFFVLSGYLITGLLLREKERTGRIALGAFYMRRAARLVPALLVMLAVVVAVKPAALPSAIDAALYRPDVEHWAFDQALVHVWSLAIEVRFYLVWPFALLLLPRRWVLPGAVIGAVASLVVRGGIESHATLGNAWALLAGAALAAAGRRLPGPTWRPLRHLGRISYGVYLWHYPLLVLNPHAGPWVRAGLVALSVAIAAASFRWFESPIIRRSRGAARGAGTAVAGMGRPLDGRLDPR